MLHTTFLKASGLNKFSRSLFLTFPIRKYFSSSIENENLEILKLKEVEFKYTYLRKPNVLVFGTEISGLIAALTLKQYDVPVDIVEHEYECPYSDDRVVILTSESIKVLKDVGINIGDTKSAIRIGNFRVMEPDGKRIASLSYESLSSLAGETFYSIRLGDLKEILRNKLQEYIPIRKITRINSMERIPNPREAEECVIYREACEARDRVINRNKNIHMHQLQSTRNQRINAEEERRKRIMNILQKIENSKISPDSDINGVIQTNQDPSLKNDVQEKNFGPEGEIQLPSLPFWAVFARKMYADIIQLYREEASRMKKNFELKEVCENLGLDFDHSKMYMNNPKQEIDFKYDLEFNENAHPQEMRRFNNNSEAAIIKKVKEIFNSPPSDEHRIPCNPDIHRFSYDYIDEDNFCRSSTHEYDVILVSEGPFSSLRDSMNPNRYEFKVLGYYDECVVPRPSNIPQDELIEAWNWNGRLGYYPFPGNRLYLYSEKPLNYKNREEAPKVEAIKGTGITPTDINPDELSQLFRSLSYSGSGPILADLILSSKCRRTISFMGNFDKDILNDTIVYMGFSSITFPSVSMGHDWTYEIVSGSEIAYFLMDRKIPLGMSIIKSHLLDIKYNIIANHFWEESINTFDSKNLPMWFHKYFTKRRYTSKSLAQREITFGNIQIDPKKEPLQKDNISKQVLQNDFNEYLKHSELAIEYSKMKLYETYKKNQIEYNDFMKFQSEHNEADLE